MSSVSNTEGFRVCIANWDETQWKKGSSRILCCCSVFFFSFFQVEKNRHLCAQLLSFTSFALLFYSYRSLTVNKNFALFVSLSLSLSVYVCHGFSFLFPFIHSFKLENLKHTCLSDWSEKGLAFEWNEKTPSLKARYKKNKANDSVYECTCVRVYIFIFKYIQHFFSESNENKKQNKNMMQLNLKRMKITLPRRKRRKSFDISAFISAGNRPFFFGWAKAIQIKEEKTVNLSQDSHTFALLP